MEDFDLATMDAQDEGELVIRHPRTLAPTGWIRIQATGKDLFRIAAAISLTFALVPAAFAQAPADHVKIDVTRAELQAIGQGIMKLPYETAAPLLIELQNQLQAQTSNAETPAATIAPATGGGGNGSSLPSSAPAQK